MSSTEVFVEVSLQVITEKKIYRINRCWKWIKKTRRENKVMNYKGKIPMGVKVLRGKEKSPGKRHRPQNRIRRRKTFCHRHAHFGRNNRTPSF